MRDILWQWVFGADGCDTDIGSFARFGERVVAGIKVLPFLERIGIVSLTAQVLYKVVVPDLELVLEQIIAVGKLAVEAKELLFFLVKRLDKEHQLHKLASSLATHSVRLTLISILFFWCGFNLDMFSVV